MKTAIFGGAFNPIHKGHISLALTLKEKIGAHRVIFIPSNISPHKSSEHLVSGEDRLKMAELAVEGYEGFEVSDLEIRKKDVSYTFETLRLLKERYPDDELFLFVGADMYMTLDSWRNADEIMQSVTVCTVPRDDVDKDRLTNKKREYDLRGAKSIIADMPLTDISSSEIRRGEKSEFLDEKVLKYINEHGLYR